MLLALLVISLMVLRKLLRSSRNQPVPGNEIEQLLARIRRGLRSLASPARAGGLFYREKQEEIGSLLSDLQGRLRLLDDRARRYYENRASQILAEAARAGITLPPLESPLITHPAPR